jgi:hypothetical protein
VQIVQNDFITHGAVYTRGRAPRAAGDLRIPQRWGRTGNVAGNWERKLVLASTMEVVECTYM